MNLQQSLAQETYDAIYPAMMELYKVSTEARAIVAGSDPLPDWELVSLLSEFRDTLAKLSEITTKVGDVAMFGTAS